MKKYLMLALMVILPINAVANNTNVSSTSTQLNWINEPFFVNKQLINGGISCIEVPKSPNFHTDSVNLDLSSSGVWQETKAIVAKDKLLKFSWNTLGVKPRPRKYLVLYRIDSRFDQPQLFIQKWDYTKNKYVTDVPAQGYINFNISDYRAYFRDVARKAMRVEAGDVINITLIDPSSFFNSDNIFKEEWDYDKSKFAVAKVNNKDLIYTYSNIDNKIIYSRAEKFCSVIINDPQYCRVSETGLQYWNVLVDYSTVPSAGKLMYKGFDQIYSGLKSCPSNTQGRDVACFYDKGRGMKILLNGGDIIKGTYESFVHVDAPDRDFLYYKSNSSGYLDITTDFDNMYGPHSIVNMYLSLPADFLHFGRYALIVEIGSGENVISPADLDSLKVEYTIVPQADDSKQSNSTGASRPSDNDTGISVTKDYKGYANSDGRLWVRVVTPNTAIQGLINVNYGYYNGATWVSDLIYNKMVSPLRNKFNNISKLIYIKLTKDATLKRIAQTMLTLYVLIYGLLFLVGSVKITVIDIVTRVVKIAIIVVLFSEDSWNFFNNNLFTVFINGTDYLISNITGSVSSVSNVFGFIDPIYDRYTSSNTWFLLLIQLFQIHNGLCFLAIMVIYSTILYFRAIIEIILGYIIAFLCMAVMISLAPFFILLILFEQTRSLFDNWLSLLFSYVVQPTILLIFFLLIDQVIAEQFIKAMVRSCWDILIKIEFHLDFNHIGIPFDFSFSLPFLPGIPFFVPQLALIGDLVGVVNTSGSFMVVATSSFLFYAYCLMSHGLVSYVTTVTQALTNVTPAQKGNASPTQSIMGDMNSVASPFVGAAKTLYDKTIGGNYTANQSPDKKNYDEKLRRSSRSNPGLNDADSKPTKNNDSE